MVYKEYMVHGAVIWRSKAPKSGENRIFIKIISRVPTRCARNLLSLLHGSIAAIKNDIEDLRS
jgi:hypothetical protein